ncbi:hypothetical protein D3C76_1667590 [compost metagenome]
MITALSVPPANIPSFISLGCRDITLGSAFSIPSAIAGKESFTRLMNKSCMAVNGLIQSNISANRMAMIAPKLPANK